jgi:NTE family protein
MKAPDPQQEQEAMAPNGEQATANGSKEAERVTAPRIATPPPITATSHGRAKFLPVEARSGVALCLSGGGFRASLFHLGGLRRLNELGVLGSVDTLTSVSGGSIFSAFLAARLGAEGWPERGGAIADWEARIAAPFRAFTGRNLRTLPLARALFSRHRGAELLARSYEVEVNGGALAQLPLRPRFVFCATNLASGAKWTFERTGMGDPEFGYMAPPADLTVGLAVAASSCFPPVFRPLPVRLDPDALAGGRLQAALEAGTIDRADYLREVRRITLSDGGVVDNLGVDVVWQDHLYLLVSDGGATLRREVGSGLLWNLGRTTAINGEQGTEIRRRWLISNLTLGSMFGGYWGIGSSTRNFGVEVPFHYPPDVVERRIATIRTDLDAFSRGEIEVLENHGYALAEAAAQKHFGALVTRPAPFRIPHPGATSNLAYEWLADSRRRELVGRA